MFQYKKRSKTAVTCVCCGFARQDKELGICTKLEDISNLGLYLIIQVYPRISTSSP